MQHLVPWQGWACFMNPGKDNCEYVSDLHMRIGKHTKLEAPLACTIARNGG